MIPSNTNAVKYELRLMFVLLSVMAMPAGLLAQMSTPSNGMDDETAALLQSLSPEELEALIAKAAEARLTYERQQVGTEIAEQVILYDPGDVEAACKILASQESLTSTGNIELIMKAFACVDGSFARARALYAEGKYKAAAEELRKTLNVRQVNYLSAAKHFLYAESLAKAEKPYDAIQAYQDLLVNMPTRLSFASAAAMRSAEAYEKLGRLMLASRMYVYGLTNYGLMIDKKTYDAIIQKIKKISEIYDDPMGHLAGEMEQVQKRLAALDSGDKTREMQKDVIVVLEDMIKTAEEQQQGGNGQSNSNKNQDKQTRQDDPSQGNRPANPNGTPPQPSNPATTSTIVPGVVERPAALSQAHSDSGNDTDWASLPPRERIKLQEAVNKVISDRYRRILGDYRTRLAEDADK